MRKGVIFLLFLFLSSIAASFIYAQVRINPRSKSALIYDFTYMDAWGFFKVDTEKKNINCMHSRLMEGLIIPPKNAQVLLGKVPKGEYPLFYPNVPIRYQIRLRNSGNSRYTGLRVVAWHRYLDAKGIWTQQEDAGKRDWSVGNLDAKQSIILNGEFEILDTPSDAGLFQTYFQVLGHDGSKKDAPEEFILDDVRPAAWCSVPSR